MQITRLRLLGFKSFVEPTELIIGAGLTGVVGPNGCGKSNLLEALRWVMGETSYKSMRGSAMDDVIFALLKNGTVTAHEAFMKAIDKNRFKEFLSTEEQSLADSAGAVPDDRKLPGNIMKKAATGPIRR